MSDYILYNSRWLEYQNVLPKIQENITNTCCITLPIIGHCSTKQWPTNKQKNNFKNSIKTQLKQIQKKHQCQNKTHTKYHKTIKQNQIKQKQKYDFLKRKNNKNISKHKRSIKTINKKMK